nr:hypothetical protein LTR18_007686 [Exophiala xenobiotica]
MWLLNTTTLQLCQVFFKPPFDPPPYAILSHTWGKEEVTFQEIGTPRAKRKLGYEKITKCCAQAKLEGLGYAWVDTCCIDKHSSAELSEAINSMFRWYSEAHICYAYLEDVDKEVDIDARQKEGAFFRSRWFRRGWTLQELLAPRHVTFFDYQWFEIGTKLSLLSNVSSITSIPHRALLDPSNIYQHSVSQRMSWARYRETTREEDIAYSLLGIFRVNMPLLYGEGTGSMLAQSPGEFYPHVHSDPHRVPTPIAVTNLGLSMSLPIANVHDLAIFDRGPEPGIDGPFVAILDCLYGLEGEEKQVGIHVVRHNGMTQWSRRSGSQSMLIDPMHVSRFPAKDVIMCIKDSEHNYSPSGRRTNILVSWKPNKFLASLSDAGHIGKFDDEKLLWTHPDTEGGDSGGFTLSGDLNYDRMSGEYTCAVELSGLEWLAIMLEPIDGRSLTIGLGAEGDRTWSFGVTHQQPHSLADTAVPMWKQFKQFCSRSDYYRDDSYWRHFGDRANYKVNDSLQFRMTIERRPNVRKGTNVRRGRDDMYRVEISPELVPLTLGQAGTKVISETVWEYQ